MKGKLLLLIGLMILISCSKDNEPGAPNKVLLLQVDYMTHTFEGGKELTMRANISQADTLPISVDYKPAGDFGYIALYYGPNHEMIFNGSIIWMGTGQRAYPESMEPANEFKELNDKLAMPEISRFQNFNSEPDDYSTIWNAVCQLEIVKEYMESHKKIGLILYARSVGFGDPNEWDWYIIMNKQDMD